jgi:G3E family GTPase
MKLFQVAGYLGSGKTTLIISLAKALSTEGQKVAILVNDVSGIPVDGNVISEYGLEVKEIGGGCICCQVAGSMKKTLELLAKNMNPDLVVIEPTGIAVPNSIKDAITLYAGKIDISFGPTIVLFDVSRAEKLLTYETLIRLVTTQLKDADIIALSKVDLVGEYELGEISDKVKAINSKADYVHLSSVTNEGLDDLKRSVMEFNVSI